MRLLCKPIWQLYAGCSLVQAVLCHVYALLCISCRRARLREKYSVANYLRMRHCDVLKWQRGHNGAISLRPRRFHLVSRNDGRIASRESRVTGVCATSLHRSSLLRTNYFSHRGKIVDRDGLLLAFRIASVFMPHFC